MKKVILLFCTVILVASCYGRHQSRSSTTTGANNTFVSCVQTSVKSIVKQFSFNPSAIYGDVFSNKAWH